MQANFSFKFYLILAAVVVVSFIATWLLPLSPFIKNLTAIPGIGSLGAITFQLLRDKISYERQKELQRKQQFFNLGVTSHMASVAFDKHVLFCEKYIDQMEKGLKQLHIEGPSTNAISLASKLALIRSESRTWLTEDILNRIRPYEQALQQIGTDDRILEYIKEHQKREKIVDRMYQIFTQVIGIKDEENQINEEIAHERIISHLQTILGIRELTELRQKVVREAIHSNSRQAD